MHLFAKVLILHSVFNRRKELQIRGENEICAIGSLATVISNVLISHFSHVEMRCDSLRFLDVYARDINYTENRLNFDRYLSLINGS